MNLYINLMNIMLFENEALNFQDFFQWINEMKKIKKGFENSNILRFFM